MGIPRPHAPPGTCSAQVAAPRSRALHLDELLQPQPPGPEEPLGQVLLHQRGHGPRPASASASSSSSTSAASRPRRPAQPRGSGQTSLRAAAPAPQPPVWAPGPGCGSPIPAPWISHPADPRPRPAGLHPRPAAPGVSDSLGQPFPAGITCGCTEKLGTTKQTNKQTKKVLQILGEGIGAINVHGALLAWSERKSGRIVQM